MTILTAIEIHTNGENIRCSGGGPDKQGKYMGWIELWRDGRLHKPLLSTQPIYNTKEAAETAMREIVAATRATPVEDILRQDNDQLSGRPHGGR
jgi:hypothetical protein